MPQRDQLGTTSEGLVRAIGRWSLVALTVNSILGSGLVVVTQLKPISLVFTLPNFQNPTGRSMSLERRRRLVELASYYGVPIIEDDPYGELRFEGPALPTLKALDNDGTVIYLGTFWPQVPHLGVRFAIVTLLLGILLIVNYTGVRSGTLVSNIFVIGKMVPLAIVCLVGAYFLSTHAAVPWPTPHAGVRTWRDALLLLFFAYGGYEAAMNPLGEARNPRRDAPFALFTALAVVTLIYTTIQWVVVGVLPATAHTDRPLAEVARLVMGSGGAALVAVGALVSVYGYLSGNFLTGPRMTFAFAEQGDFPRVFGAVHPRFKTPHVSIVAFAVLCWVLALAGSFTWNVTLSAVARLVYYGAVCAAVPALRRRQPGAAWLRLPAGWLFAGAGVLICVALLSGVDFSGSVILLVTHHYWRAELACGSEVRAQNFADLISQSLG